MKQNLFWVRSAFYFIGPSIICDFSWLCFVGEKLFVGLAIYFLVMQHFPVFFTDKTTQYFCRSSLFGIACAKENSEKEKIAAIWQNRQVRCWPTGSYFILHASGTQFTRRAQYSRLFLSLTLEMKIYEPIRYFFVRSNFADRALNHQRGKGEKWVSCTPEIA